MYATHNLAIATLVVTCLMGHYVCEEGNKLSEDVKKDKLTPLHFGAIFPMTGESWNGGQGGKPAVDMALKDVNARPDVLPGYELIMVFNDSEVS